MQAVHTHHQVGLIGIDFQGPVITGQGLGKLPFLLEKHAEVVVGVGIAWLELEGTA